MLKWLFDKYTTLSVFPITLMFTMYTAMFILLFKVMPKKEIRKKQIMLMLLCLVVFYAVSQLPAKIFLILFQT